MRNIQRLIYVALLFAIAIYGVVAFIIGKDTGVPLVNRLHDPVVIVLYVIAVINYFMAFLVSASLEQRGTPAQTVNVTRWALLESMAVVGVVAALLHHDWRVFLPPAVLAVIGFARSWPG